MARAKVVFLMLLVFGAATLAVSSPAAAKTTPCWKQVLNDWTRDQVINDKYPSRCIDEAIAKVPEDIRAYTDFVDQAEASRQARELYGSSGGSGDTDDPDDSVPGSMSNLPREREPNTDSNSKD